MNKGGATFFYQSKFLRWLLFALMGALIFSKIYFNCSSSSWRDLVGLPRHYRSMTPAKSQRIVRQIPIDKERWSGWQNIPPSKFCRVSSPSWLDIQFIDGETHHYEKNEIFYLDKVKKSIFRFRGEGTVTLEIEDLN